MSSEPKHSHYFKNVAHLTTIDVYRVLELFNVTDPAIQHAVKKLLVAGGRGAGKDINRDIQEAIDTMLRWQSMQAENASSQLWRGFAYMVFEDQGVRIHSKEELKEAAMKFLKDRLSLVPVSSLTCKHNFGGQPSGDKKTKKQMSEHVKGEPASHKASRAANRRARTPVAPAKPKPAARTRKRAQAKSKG